MAYNWSLHCNIFLQSRSQESQMTIKFEKETRRLKTMIRLSGRLQSKHLDELKTQMEGARPRIALDLNGVTLVDVEIVRFLNACEKSGVELLNCWPYIQEWMIREKGRE
jgi:ABC-type transporter Mla MlaB component